ncbi:MAG: NFACT RNA binding domain-containing protein, partial [Methanomassiliicoccales archaeon]
ISSEGCLVLGGRDAKSNERLVQKHMEDGDRYVHADIYGAPSVVVKWREGASDATLEEACTFAVCFSRAWNAKIGSAAAYWVHPDQVSKTPASGEYLKTGSFVIRGRRNYFPKLKLELCLGHVEYEGEMKLVCAPPGAFRHQSTKYFLILPGDKTKEEIASELSERLGAKKDDIVSVLPPGGSEWKETEGK